jgi:hypothetical protein
MIILSDDFLRDIKRYPVDFKGRVLDAIYQLSANPTLRRGTRKKGSRLFFDAVGKKWQLSYEVTDGGDLYLFPLWTHDMSVAQKKSGIEIGGFIPGKKAPFDKGFSGTDFDVLKSAFDVPDKVSEEQYFKNLSETIYPKLAWLGGRVQDDLSKELGVNLYAQLADKGNIGSDPVVWVAFVKSMESPHVNQSQLTFHLGIGECIHESKDRSPHFCIKTATFRDKPDSRRFWKNISRDRQRAIEAITKSIRMLGSSYEIRFYQEKRERPIIQSARLDKNDRETVELLLEYMCPESLKKDFFGFSFNKYYDFHDKRVAEGFSDMEYVARELVREFSKLMYLYFWFSEDDPMSKIAEYKERQIALDNRRS